MNIYRKELTTEKTGVIGGLDLSDKAEHSREREREKETVMTFVETSSSSRMHVMNHNWSTMKQRLHPQSAAKISCHSVLSDSTMWDIVWVSPQGHRSVSVSCHFLLQTLQCLQKEMALFRAKMVQQRHWDAETVRSMVNFIKISILISNDTGSCQAAASCSLVTSAVPLVGKAVNHTAKHTVYSTWPVSHTNWSCYTVTRHYHTLFSLYALPVYC